MYILLYCILQHTIYNYNYNMNTRSHHKTNHPHIKTTKQKRHPRRTRTFKQIHSRVNRVCNSSSSYYVSCGGRFPHAVPTHRKKWVVPFLQKYRNHTNWIGWARVCVWVCVCVWFCCVVEVNHIRIRHLVKMVNKSMIPNDRTYNIELCVALLIRWNT